jgi:hypothetical protein
MKLAFHLLIILHLLVVLGFSQEKENANASRNPVQTVKLLTKKFGWFAIVTVEGDKLKVDWIRNPPAEVVASLTPFIEVESKIAKKTKTNHFVFCASKRGFSVKTIQIRDNSVVIDNLSITLDKFMKILHASLE